MADSSWAGDKADREGTEMAARSIEADHYIEVRANLIHTHHDPLR